MKIKNRIKGILMITASLLAIMFFINSSLATTTAKVVVETGNLREEANEDCKILEQLSLNEEVEVIENLDGWYKVKAKGITGYLRADLIAINEGQEEAETASTSVENQNTQTTETTANQETSSEQVEELKVNDKKYITVDTKLKIVPAINATEIVEVKKNDEVTVIEIHGDWVCVQNDNTKGWIRKDKLGEKEEEPKQEEVKTEEPKVETKIAYVNSDTVNLRKEPSTSSEVVANLTLNTEVTILEENAGWAKVKSGSHEGYIATSLLSDTKKEVTTSRSSTGARKPVEESKTETTMTTSSAGTATGSAIVSKAKSYIGCSYVYGGSSPSGFDCSGFTSYIYKQFGISINRTAQAQYSNGVSVSRANLQLGDLIMFGPSANSINHVGIYIGGGMIVHAANPSRGVTTDTINSGYYNNNYVGARRVI